MGRTEGQTLRYPAGRPIHGLFVIVFRMGKIACSVVSALKWGGVAFQVLVPGIFEQHPHVDWECTVEGYATDTLTLEKDGGVVIRR